VFFFFSVLFVCLFGLQGLINRRAGGFGCFGLFGMINNWRAVEQPPMGLGVVLS